MQPQTQTQTDTHPHAHAHMHITGTDTDAKERVRQYKQTKKINQKQDEEMEHSQVHQSVTVFIVVQCTEHPPTLVQAFILNEHG
jgi:hypothetical protein